MKVKIEKVGKTGDREHFRILTPVEVKTEDELRYQKEVSALINDDYHTFEKGNNPEFPNTWFLHITRHPEATIIE